MERIVEWVDSEFVGNGIFGGEAVGVLLGMGPGSDKLKSRVHIFMLVPKLGLGGPL